LHLHGFYIKLYFAPIKMKFPVLLNFAKGGHIYEFYKK